jgi:hypothetical protein
MLSLQSRINDLLIDGILRLASQSVEERLSLRLGRCFVPQLNHDRVSLRVRSWCRGVWLWKLRLCGQSCPHLKKIWRVWHFKLSQKKLIVNVIVDMILPTLLRC